MITANTATQVYLVKFLIFFTQSRSRFEFAAVIAQICAHSSGNFESFQQFIRKEINFM
jgi:hypothetical protein